VAHVPLESAVRLSANTTAASSASLRTNTYYKYQAGYTQLGTLSVVHSNTGSLNQFREWGYYEDSDGLFFRLSGSALGITERSSVSGLIVDNFITQSSWNRDPMNGSGSSGVILDVSKGNLYEIEVQWYGVGTTRYFVDNVFVHESAHANKLSVPYMRTAQLPLQAKIYNNGISTAGSMDVVCGRVAAQGQVNDPQQWLYAARTPNPVLIGLTAAPVLSIRPKALYNSIPNRMWCLPKRLTVGTDGYSILFQIVMGATLSGSNFVSAAAASGVEYDVSATSYTGGEIIYADTIELMNGSNEEDLDQFFSVFSRMIRNCGYMGTGNNVNDVLTVTAVNTTVGFTPVRANITWAEIR